MPWKYFCHNILEWLKASNNIELIFASASLIFHQFMRFLLDIILPLDLIKEMEN